MVIRWYVLPRGDHYAVLREAKPHGKHETRQRAIDAALFMATVEANMQGYVGEIFVEDEHGRMLQALVRAPRETKELQADGLIVRHVGLDRVLVPA